MKIEQPGAIIQPGIGSRATEGEFMDANVRLSAGERNPPPAQTAQVKQEIEKEKEATLFAGASLEFSVDTDTNRIAVKVVDNETRELVRQIPMEEMLALAKAMNQLQGLLLRTKA
ncbi:flagellar protein FlaG [Nitrosospira multiformis]|uniref:Flagellar protein FlaG n=1 Tax=Nitrosospira multiformis TaxID=1231 RepID=A0A1I7IIG7_9PROT|nr:flagellar protein FlaG [Nitrosospira multiformis]SFU72666.1 flagellar protein FlaG [Nitrosospira multiformis]